MIRFIEAAAERTAIAREILEALTDWFEVEESREKFIEDSAQQPFWASLDGDMAEGFLCLKETGKATVELAVMGVRKECHRKGIGRKLFAAAKDYAARKGYDFIQVKTVRSGVYADYAALQKKQGFPIEQYGGMDAVRYTFKVKNYPSNEKEVVADLVVSGQSVIAGDIQSTALDGFMTELKTFPSPGT